MEFTSSWGVERVWGNYSYYHTGEPAADKYAFVIDSGISLNTNASTLILNGQKALSQTVAPLTTALVTAQL